MCSFSFSFEPAAWQGESPLGFNGLLYSRVNPAADWQINHSAAWEMEAPGSFSPYFNCSLFIFEPDGERRVPLLAVCCVSFPKTSTADACKKRRDWTLTATPFGREIDSDILISSSSGSGTPIIFLSKINLPLWKCQSSPVRLRNTTVLFCWLIWWQCCGKMKTGASDRPFRPFHFSVRSKDVLPLLSVFCSTKPRTFLHKTAWHFYPWKNKTRSSVSNDPPWYWHSAVSHQIN